MKNRKREGDDMDVIVIFMLALAVGYVLGSWLYG